MEFVVDNLFNCRITHMYDILALHWPSIGVSMGKQNTHAHTHTHTHTHTVQKWETARQILGIRTFA